MGGILFVSAGRMDWWEAWVILAIYFLIVLVAALWMMRTDPELLKERDQAITKKNVKPWDRVMITLNWLLTIALFVVIGLDAGRFQASVVPPGVRLLGLLIVFSSFGLTLWASRVNTYMSAAVRIQAERGHQAVTVGPYRRVRHPMYVAMCLLDAGLPLVLGSWWGLVVSGLMIVAVIIRTALEDKTLQRELPGYAEYVQRVRYRLLPGVW
jgi:protein-S-isoprenylcysteine O-methyltransferase Ste14